MLQLPGILLVFFIPGREHFLWRVGGMVLIQSILWYGVMAVGLRWRSRVKRSVVGSEDLPRG
jgi:hypothetical protein